MREMQIEGGVWCGFESKKLLHIFHLLGYDWVMLGGEDMTYDDKLVYISENLKHTLNKYIQIVGLKIESVEDFIAQESKHRFIQDQYEKYLSELSEFKPTKIFDGRKEVLMDHFEKIKFGHSEIVKVFDNDFSIETVEKYNDEVEKFNELLDDLSKDLKSKIGK